MCSIGERLSLECNDRTLTSVSSVEILQDDLKKVISLRTGIESHHLMTICAHHKMQFDKYYSSRIISCCNILKKHRKSVKTNLTTITMRHHEQFPQLIPGKKICYNCLKALKGDSESSNNGSEGNDEPFTSKNVVDEDLGKINQLLVSCDVSPVRKRRLSGDQLKLKIAKKAGEVKDKILEFAYPDQSSSDLKKEEEYIENLINSLQLKINSTDSTQKKIQLLTLVPHYYTLEDIINIFGVSQYIARKSKELLQEKGILGTPDRVEKNEAMKIPEEVKADVRRFYENDENSRVLPGKKDCVSVRIDGEKRKVQKRLILCNLKELYLQWKQNTTYQLGFSFFASLRPPWCVLAGAAGTHTVCVCTLHQNPKLKLKALGTRISITDLMKTAVCHEDNRACMMHECMECPGKEELMKTVADLVSENIDEQESIQYHQWISTDRCSLKTIEETIGDFTENLVDDIHNLTVHHFVSKSQSMYLNELKAHLQPNQSILQLDFAENYTCIQQESAQASYFSKQQVTLHPYVLYFKSDNQLKTQSFCIVSDHMVHDSATVDAFNKKLLLLVMSKYPWIAEINFFSDGAVAQYKNR